MNFIIEGGWEYMSVLLVLLLLILVLFGTGLKNITIKRINLLKELSLFALVFSLFAVLVDLINVLEVISIATSVPPQVLASGFSDVFLRPCFGVFIFLVGRLCAIILIAKKK